MSLARNTKTLLLFVEICTQLGKQTDKWVEPSYLLRVAISRRETFVKMVATQPNNWTRLDKIRCQFSFIVHYLISSLFKWCLSLCNAELTLRSSPDPWIHSKRAETADSSVPAEQRRSCWSEGVRSTGSRDREELNGKIALPERYCFILPYISQLKCKGPSDCV